MEVQAQQRIECLLHAQCWLCESSYSYLTAVSHARESDAGLSQQALPTAETLASGTGAPVRGGGSCERRGLSTACPREWLVTLPLCSAMSCTSPEDLLCGQFSAGGIHLHLVLS